MISSFSGRVGTCLVVPGPTHAFFPAGGSPTRDRLRRLGAPRRQAQLLDLVDGRGPSRVGGQPFHACYRELLGAAVVHRVGDASPIGWNTAKSERLPVCLSRI